MKHMPITTPPAKLAFVLPDLRGGGAERVMLTFANELAGFGYAPHLILARAEGVLMVDAQRAGLPITDLKVNRLRSVAAPLRDWLRQNKPSALVPAMWPLTSIAVWAARGTGVPVITTDHATLSDQYARKGMLHRLALRASIRATYPKARANVSVSAGSARDLERLGHLPDGRVKVIHNPVAMPNPQTGTAAWPAQARHRILAVGSLRWQKDFPTLLRALRLLLDRGCDGELVILGDGPDRAALSGLVRSLGLSDRVAMPGFTPHTGAYYASADLFVLSSSSEGFANVIVEALSHGLPIVSTDCPHGPAEILGARGIGRLTPVGDATALANGVEVTLREPRNPDAARARASDFRPDAATAKFLSLLPQPQSSKLARRA
ncbi:glycosyltransferase [Aliiroseovarius sp. Z3]|uniref:glycosyltransferase n=1 Tax=Aliiroseovarius sp. Z3 TaxID=2811402 RepID=UPI0023B32477|nr:glycosyltransferase [Aliiroseovarius sp. Z3]MDE9450361.1 glycosyltransferase [Aliiroseovarius sp. Z3]